MLGKLLTRAKEWLKPSSQTPDATPERAEISSAEAKPSPENAQPVPNTTVGTNPPTPAVEKDANPAEAKTEESVIPETADSQIDDPEENAKDEQDWFHFQEGDFQFSMPLDPEEREVLAAAQAHYEEMKKNAEENGSPWSKHSLDHQRAMQYWSLQIYYKDQAQAYYKRRSEDPQALDMAIRYCEKQIRYAPMAIHANRMNPQAKELPQHYGYKQLAIIYDKKGDLDRAIELCKQARDEGWKGDWTTRIERYEKRRT
ncbi:hypothetical protein [Salinithrix halophila]|uniref:Tetratricopeptide repeat protein n=1 Tax=Salinithrix halophila TaxID=1485204 RepID=A0ABV8JGQ4_9BACL